MNNHKQNGKINNLVDLEGSFEIPNQQPAPPALETDRIDLSIVVVSYNTVNLLRQCLTSFFNNLDNGFRFQVIVVDNASADGSAEMVRHDFPLVHLIANADNRGFAAANNQGFALAQGDYLLLLNPDTEVIGDAVWKMLRFLVSQPQAAVVGPALLYPDHSFQESAFKFPTISQIFLDFFPLNWRFTRSRLNGRYPRQWYEGSAPEPFEIDFPLGACLMVRRSILEAVGLMDEQFFMYMEEIDLCYRIKKAAMPAGYRPVGLRFRPGRRKPSHWKIFCLPGARIIHHSGASARQFREEMQVQLYRSRTYFYRKHYGAPFNFVARQLTRIGTSWQMLSALVGRLRGKVTTAEVRSRMRATRRIWGLK